MLCWGDTLYKLICFKHNWVLRKHHLAYLIKSTFKIKTKKRIINEFIKNVLICVYVLYFGSTLCLLHRSTMFVYCCLSWTENMVPQAITVLLYINYLIKLIAMARGPVPVRNLLLNLHLNRKTLTKIFSWWVG